MFDHNTLCAATDVFSQHRVPQFRESDKPLALIDCRRTALYLPPACATGDEDTLGNKPEDFSSFILAYI
jgi:hypothetical protein